MLWRRDRDEAVVCYRCAVAFVGDFYPAAGGFIKVPDAVFFAGNMGDKANSFVITNGVGGQIVFGVCL